MSKKKVKLKKSGKEIEVYPDEVLKLYKKGLLDVSKKDAEKLDEQLKSLEPAKVEKVPPGTMFDALEKRVKKLEDQVAALKKPVKEPEKDKK